MRLRRKGFHFTGTCPQTGEENRLVKVLAHSPASARQTLAEAGWKDTQPWSPPAGQWGFDKRAVKALARSMGVKWSVRVVRGRSLTTHGTCTTDLTQFWHKITVSRYCDDPERVIRHELAHALENEREFAAFGFDPQAVARARRRDKRSNGYYDSRTEVHARGMESFRRDMRTLKP